VARVGLCSRSDVIAFAQKWHHLHSSCAGGNDLSNDNQNLTDQLTGACDMHENAQKKNLSEKHLAKL